MRTTQLEYFVSVARHLNFTKAAEECYIAQSAISQQISALEEELGFALFSRQTRKVQLTEAGVIFYKETLSMLEHLKETTMRCRAVAEGLSGTLRIGIAGYTQAVYMNDIKTFISLYPGIKVEFINMDTKRQYDQLVRREFDIALTAEFNLATRPEIRLFGTCHYPLAIFMNEHHPLASLSNVTLADASRYTNIFAAMDDSVEMVSTASELYQQNGYTLPEILYVPDHNMTTLLLDFDRGVAIAPKEIETFMPANVVCRTLEENHFTIPLTWAYSRTNENPALLKLIEFMINKEN